MSIIKNITAGLAVSGLLISSTAFASGTRSDTVAPRQGLHPLTLAAVSKVKRHTPSEATYYSNDGATNDLLFGLAGLAIGAGACAAIPCATKYKSPGT